MLAVGALLVLAAFSAVLITHAPARYVIALILLVVALAFTLTNPHARRVWPVLLVITFPITIRVFGNDAFSTGTLLVAILFVIHLASGGKTALPKDRILLFLLSALLVVAAIGVLSGMPRSYWMTGVRHWVNLASSVGVFLLILGWGQASRGNLRTYVEAVIAALLCVAALHVVLSFALRQFPALETYLSAFLTTGQESLGEVSSEGYYARATTTFTRGEEFGELLVLLFPFGLYKLLTSRVYAYLPLTILLFAGMLYTGTRSSLLLMSLQLFLFCAILVFRRSRSRSIMIVSGFLLLLVATTSLVSLIMDTALSRFAVSAVLWEEESSFSALLNRDVVWSSASAVVRTTLSLFGHGPVQAHVIGYGDYNFHSLYMTWVYQFGILGTAVWALFFTYLFRRLWSAFRSVRFKEDGGGLLIIACHLSLLGFLVNEIKFEFNRSDSYQQMVWVVFALFYMAAASTHSRPLKPTQTQPNVVAHTDWGLGQATIRPRTGMPESPSTDEVRGS
jgi:hypothetical protein